MAGCRDCSRCTESCLASLIMLPFRILFSSFTLFSRAVQARCPQCSHPLAWHARDRSRRFKD
jgi:hypothetical protein